MNKLLLSEYADITENDRISTKSTHLMPILVFLFNLQSKSEFWCNILISLIKDAFKSNPQNDKISSKIAHLTLWRDSLRTSNSMNAKN